MPEETPLKRIRCRCGKAMRVKADRTKGFECVACGKKLKLKAPIEIEPEPAIVERSRRQIRRRNSSQATSAEASACEPTPTKRHIPLSPPRKEKRQRKKRAPWDSSRWTTAYCWTWGFILLGIGTFAAIALAILIPNALTEFSPPNDQQLTVVSGKPLDIKRTQTTTRRGSFELVTFLVDGRQISLDESDWPESKFEQLTSVLSQCDELSVKLCKKKSVYVAVPFWEIKADNKVVVTEASMLAKHRRDRWGCVLLPSLIVLFFIVALGCFFFDLFIYKR